EGEYILKVPICTSLLRSADNSCEISWLTCLLKDLQVQVPTPVPILCDNASTIALASNPIHHARTKHIEIDCHFVINKIKAGDIFTKGLSRALHYNRIKAWNSSYRELTNCRKNTFKTELTNLDSVLDRGEGIDTDVTIRSDVVRILQDIEKTEAMEVAQKAKIKWAVEGYENSKYRRKPRDILQEIDESLCGGEHTGSDWTGPPDRIKHVAGDVAGDEPESTPEYGYDGNRKSGVSDG
nr:uncharacterized mitochondrial protein AtMg00810-like [Tanacetum cinerariifolium]